MVRKNNIEMYSMHNEGKSIKSLKIIENIINKYMNAISKNVYIDTLGDEVNKYNIT